jgi:hypothetical protein
MSAIAPMGERRRRRPPHTRVARGASRLLRGYSVEVVTVMPTRAQGLAEPALSKADRSLRRLLEEGESDQHLVSAVMRLKPRAAPDLALPPQETERTARAVVERVADRMGEEPTRLNVFRNLGAFLVCATTSFVRELLSQPEVLTAVANRSGEDFLIRPQSATSERARPRRRSR